MSIFNSEVVHRNRGPSTDTADDHMVVTLDLTSPVPRTGP
ncbi:hypothetical protein HMPREF9577_00555 [Cutibacterium acnes HL110PA3]|nr:hypothetical protein HMPREF9577_00555 [Cutibacterium acnes HL110PA3]